MDLACGKQLASALPGLIRALERHGELTLKPEVRRKPLSISPAAIDRLLAGEGWRSRTA